MITRSIDTCVRSNRGKRDSQLILMKVCYGAGCVRLWSSKTIPPCKFLNKVFFDKRMMPLELEIYRQMRDIIGVEPAVYEYCLMVDADTEVMPDALNRLVAFMVCRGALLPNTRFS